ncbi:MAG: decaprenyl-phosphate phosphoribosyltransferase [Chloroflexales bacterium]|nr:decaprenyl-phosphate phosphoribosyltransferase [Chloroflexales bacterium]
MERPFDTGGARAMEVPRQLLRAMRPKEWVKNVFVFAALAFSVERLWTNPSILLQVTLAAVAFCLAASAIYLINDLVDIEKDRAHPVKRNRPLASGKLSPNVAASAAVVLIGAALALAYAIAPDFGFMSIIAAYFVVQGLLYSYWLKNVVIFDILILAAGFVLRAIGGALVIKVSITPWLLVCMGLLALFLGIGKRRQELVLLEGGAGEHRRILAEYSVPMLDQMISIITASIVMAYSITTYLAPAAPQKPFPLLMITIPFVVYGIFRYLYLIHQRNGGGSPTELLLKDRPLAASVLLWGLCVLAIQFFFR